MSDRSTSAARFGAQLRHGWLVPPVIAVLIALVGLTILGQYDQRQLITIAVYALIVGGLNLSFGYGGELAFGQVAMFATGAYTAGVLAQHGSHELVIALVAAIVLAGVVGVLSGAPGLRLSHWSLALVSFFLVLLLPDILSVLESQTGGLLGLSGTVDPTLFGVHLSFEGFFVFALVIAYLWIVIMRNLVLSRYGTSLKVLRENPLLAQSLGLSVYRLRIMTYVLGGLPAGAAGVLYAYLNGFLSPEAFTLQLAIAILAASVVGGTDSIYGAPVGAALLILGPLQTSSFQRSSVLIYGAFLIVVGVLFGGGLAAIGRGGLQRLLARLPRVLLQPAPTRAELHGEAQEALRIPGERLTVSGAAKSFGGLKALQGVELTAEPGRITALLGANGAGKTTLLNAVSGFVRIDSGEVSIGSERLDGLAPHEVARIGVGRTFQTPVIPRGMSVVEVVETARLRSGRVSMLASVLRLGQHRRARQDDREVAMAALTFADLDALAGQDAQTLPLGTRRLLEVVRAVAREPRIMLLDEPAAGLDDAALAELGALIRRARDAGATIVLVEHNVPFVLGLADDIHVMELGKVIASGTPDEIRGNPVVIASYLGRGAADRDQADVAGEERV
jgi:branched-chain amino acid transport system permease protein